MLPRGLGACFEQLRAEIRALTYKLQAASRVFHANRSMLTNHQVCVKDRPTFCQGSPYIFHANVSLTRGFEMKMVTPMACFAAGNRKIFKQELAALDVAHRKLLRRVVGPPAGMDWSRPWHKILHEWNVRVSIFVGQPWLETLVTHMSKTTLDIWSLCDEITL